MKGRDSEAQATELTYDQRVATIMQIAQALVANPFTDWATFLREVLGNNGVVTRMFSGAALDEFRRSEEYTELQRMLAKLRGMRPVQDGRTTKPDLTEPRRMITVRVPASMLELLRAEARERNTSINSLCIAKLLQSLQADDLAGPDARFALKRKLDDESPQPKKGAHRRGGRGAEAFDEDLSEEADEMEVDLEFPVGRDDRYEEEEE